jgi:hypothetical protein
MYSISKYINIYVSTVYCHVQVNIRNNLLLLQFATKQSTRQKIQLAK